MNTTTGINAIMMHSFHPFRKKGSHAVYLVHENSSLAKRAGLAGRYLRYREVRKRLEHFGCVFVRAENGSHETWRGRTNRNSPYPGTRSFQERNSSRHLEASGHSWWIRRLLAGCIRIIGIVVPHGGRQYQLATLLAISALSIDEVTERDICGKYHRTDRPAASRVSGVEFCRSILKRIARDPSPGDAPLRNRA